MSTLNSSTENMEGFYPRATGPQAITSFWIAFFARMVMAAPARGGGSRAAGIAPRVQHQRVRAGRAGPIGAVAPFTSAPVAPFVTAPVGAFGTSPFATAPGGRVIETFRAVPAPI